MGYIYEQIEITGMFKKKTLSALFDSGAGWNYIRRYSLDGKELVNNIGFHISEGKHESRLANGSCVEGERVRFKKIRIKTREEENPMFIIMDDLTDDVFIGAELMQRLGIVLDVPSEKIVIIEDMTWGDINETPEYKK